MEYLVTDMGAAAFLLCKGIRHVGLRPTGSKGQLAFVYADPIAREEVNNYFCGGVVPGRQFADCLRAAKSLIYDSKPIYHGPAKDGGAK
jgi:hypothetical protein